MIINGSMALHDPKTSYLSLCYHYLRQGADRDPFPRIRGTSWEGFAEHLTMLRERCNMVSFSDVLRFHEQGVPLPGGKPNILLTFDDGLAEHARAAEILSEQDIRAIFFIPSCLITERIPINAAVIHYTLARYGIAAFLEGFREALSANNLDSEKYLVRFREGADKALEKIAEIKTVFKYRLPHGDSQKTILHMYNSMLLKEYPDMFSRIHLTLEQMKRIVSLGHDIGAHTHTHVSIGSANLSDGSFQKEVVESQKILEDALGISVESISYPFGEKKDYDSTEEMVRKLGLSRAGFIAEPGLNTKETSPFRIARYLVLQKDTAEMLRDKVTALARGEEVAWRY